MAWVVTMLVSKVVAISRPTAITILVAIPVTILVAIPVTILIAIPVTILVAIPVTILVAISVTILVAISKAGAVWIVNDAVSFSIPIYAPAPIIVRGSVRIASGIP